MVKQKYRLFIFLDSFLVNQTSETVDEVSLINSQFVIFLYP